MSSSLPVSVRCSPVVAKEAACRLSGFFVLVVVLSSQKAPCISTNLYYLTVGLMLRRIFLEICIFVHIAGVARRRIKNDIKCATHKLMI